MWWNELSLLYRNISKNHFARDKRKEINETSE